VRILDRKSKTITLELIGGLGNQLFQVAALAFLVETQNLSPIIQCSRIGTGFSPRKFEIPEGLIKTLIPNTKLIRHKNLIDRLYNRISWKLEASFGLSNSNYKYVSSETGFDLNLTKDFNKSLFSGYFQTYYYAEALDWKKKIFQYSQQSDLFVNLKSKIIQSEAIGIHIRGGDYLQDTSGTGNLNSEYFFESLRMADGFKKNVWVFSDDVEYAKNILRDFPIDPQYIDEKRELSAFETILLMSSLKKLIISNSTFAWWGAYLNESSEIYAPTKWFEKKQDPKLLIPNSWKRVKSLWKI
jgi:hypothetical protein